MQRNNSHFTEIGRNCSSKYSKDMLVICGEVENLSSIFFYKSNNERKSILLIKRRDVRACL